MKASEIERLLNGSKRVMIWVDDNGIRAEYTVNDCIGLNEENMLSVLGADRDEREKIRCSMESSYDPQL